MLPESIKPIWDFFRWTEFRSYMCILFAVSQRFSLPPLPLGLIYLRFSYFPSAQKDLFLTHCYIYFSLLGPSLCGKHSYYAFKFRETGLIFHMSSLWETSKWEIMVSLKNNWISKLLTLLSRFPFALGALWKHSFILTSFPMH